MRTEKINHKNQIKLTSNQAEVLSELEKTQDEFWNIAPESGNFLNMLIKISKSKNVLEIGTSNGYSAIWLALALRETGGRLTTIEFWDKRQNVAIENFKKCGLDDIITTKLGSAMDILPQIDSEIDFAFIDANKGEYVKYFEILDKKLKVGGIIAADNITSHAEKVAPFVDMIESSPNYQVEILDLPAGMLLAYKVS